MNVHAIQREMQALVTIKDSTQKLQQARCILAECHKAEREAASDFSIPFDQVHALKVIIPDVIAAVSRLEAGLRRRKAK